jgi:hypothetical protein
LEIILNMTDFDVEGDEVTVELVLVEVKKLMLHPSEVLHVLVELLDDPVDVLELVHAERAELLNRGEELGELVDTAAE